MASNQRPSNNWIELVAEILRHRGRTGRAVLLVVALGIGVALATTPPLLIMVMFGPHGATAVAGLGAMLTGGATTYRAVAARRSARKLPPGS